MALVGVTWGVLILHLFINLSSARVTDSVKYPIYRDYTPCRASTYYPFPFKLECNAVGWNNPSSDDVVEAFRKNTPNDNIESLSIVGSEFNHMVTRANLDEIFQLVAAGSADTVKEIYLSDLDMTSLPDSINRFQNLDKLSVRNFKEIPKLGSGFINLQNLPALRTLNLMKNRIFSIDPDAFQGDFSQVEINLGSNLFVTLDEKVFLPLLQSMYRNLGRVIIFPNDIVCGCGLTWLIRDRRELLPYLVDTECHDIKLRRKVNIGDWDWQNRNCSGTSDARQTFTYSTSVTLLSFALLITYFGA